MTGWLDARDQRFRGQVEIVAMDGFGGDHSAATTALPDAVTVMDPSHVVALAGHKLELCRQRVQRDTLGHRGRTADPLYRVRRTLGTRLGPLTDRQRARLETVSAGEEHAAVEVTWWAYQQIIAAYATTDRRRANTALAAVTDQLRTGLPDGLKDLATLGQTLHRRRDDVPATSIIAPRTVRPRPSTAVSKPSDATPTAFRNLINYRIQIPTAPRSPCTPNPEEPS